MVQNKRRLQARHLVIRSILWVRMLPRVNWNTFEWLKEVIIQWMSHYFFLGAQRGLAWCLSAFSTWLWIETVISTRSILLLLHLHFSAFSQCTKPERLPVSNQVETCSRTLYQERAHAAVEILTAVKTCDTCDVIRTLRQTFFNVIKVLWNMIRYRVFLQSFLRKKVAKIQTCMTWTLYTFDALFVQYSNTTQY